MTYITTKVHTLKSYPTYQFYAAADSAATDADGVFKICILETMRWIRSRLSDQGELPPEIDTPLEKQPNRGALWKRTDLKPSSSSQWSLAGG